jgi:hypothetical protein
MNMPPSVLERCGLPMDQFGDSNGELNLLTNV